MQGAIQFGAALLINLGTEYNQTGYTIFMVDQRVLILTDFRSRGSLNSQKSSNAAPSHSQRSSCGNLQELLDGAMAKMPLLSISGRKRKRELEQLCFGSYRALLSSRKRLPLSRNFEHNTALPSSSNSRPAGNIFAVAVNEIRNYISFPPNP